MNAEFDHILAECLDALQSRQAGVDECLARYPEHRTELEPLLTLAAELRDVHLPAPSPALRVRMRRQVLERARRGPTWAARLAALWPAPVPRWAFALALMLVVLLGGYGVVRALPGDLLYPIKPATENVVFWLESRPAAQAEWHLTYADRRLAEAQELAPYDRPNDITDALRAYRAHVLAALALLDSMPDGIERMALAARIDDALVLHSGALNALAARRAATPCARPGIGR
jgi:hypothetical protein